MKKINVKVCVIGGGAGGFGCVYRLVKNGISVAVADVNPSFGGTSVYGGVNCWEPGVSLDGVHTLLVDELLKIDDGCFVAETVPNCRLLENKDEYSFEKYPWGLSVGSDKKYTDTLKRCKNLVAKDDGMYWRFQFDDAAMVVAMNNVLKPYENKIQRFFGYSVTDFKKDGEKIVSVTIQNGTEDVEIFADYFVDGSGSIVLARMAGCEYTVGSEERSKYDEESAPEEKDMNINGTTYVFRVAKAENPAHIDEIPEIYADFDASEKLETVSCFNMYPNGDINVNMLPTMSGEEYLSLDKKADFVGNAIVHHYWNHLQKCHGMSGYKLVKIFNAGIREDYRVVGRFVLTENDLRDGIFKQRLNERIIAVGDHALDIHGNAGCCSELDLPYGIPVDCSFVKEYDNLFIACRGASFSHIAASSARLTRCMMSFGEGVGEYISENIQTKSFKNEVQGKGFEKFKKAINLLR